MNPYRAPAEELPVRVLPHPRAARIAKALGLWDSARVRRWIGGRWECWTLSVIPISLWFRVIEWTDASNIAEAREHNGIFSTVWISREDWSIVQIEEWP